MEPIDKLKQQWQQEKAAAKGPNPNSIALIKEAKQQKNQSLSAHIITIIVLSITLCCLTAFFYYVAPFKETLSRIGVFAMCGGLVLRILIEILSLIKSRALQFDADANISAKAAQSFYAYRVKIHGGITYFIVAAYILGFYSLTPEFMKYIATSWVLIMDIGFVFIAVTLFYFLRKGVVNELAILKAITVITKDLEE